MTKATASVELFKAGIELRRPSVDDGSALHGLVVDSQVLDVNSRYCYLLIASHFRDTSVVAECAGRCLGFISAYRRPDVPDTLFVWQVMVHAQARRQGLALRMLLEILARDDCRDLCWVEATVTADNHPSRALFSRLAWHLSCPLAEGPGFDREAHFHNTHDSEKLVRIGPISHPLSISSEGVCHDGIR